MGGFASSLCCQLHVPVLNAFLEQSLISRLNTGDIAVMGTILKALHVVLKRSADPCQTRPHSRIFWNAQIPA